MVISKVIILLAVFFGVLCRSSAAPTEVTNGGVGVMMGGQPFLLDLVEVGYEKDPFFDQSISPPIRLEGVLKEILPHPSFPHELIARKLAEIDRIDPSTALLFLKTMELFNWRIVKGPFISLKDHRPVIDPAHYPYVTIAARGEKTIFLDRDFWEMMTPGNRAALVFHEVIYALAPPVNNEQPIAPVQELTGWLFTPDIARYPSLVEAGGFYGSATYRDGEPLFNVKPIQGEDYFRVQHGRGFLQLIREVLPPLFVKSEFWLGSYLNISRTPGLIGYNMILSPSEGEPGWEWRPGSSLEFDKVDMANKICKRKALKGFASIDMHYSFVLLELGVYRGKNGGRYSYVRIREVLSAMYGSAGKVTVGTFTGASEDCEDFFQKSFWNVLERFVWNLPIRRMDMSRFWNVTSSPSVPESQPGSNRSM